METIHLDTHIAIWLFSGEWTSRLKRYKKTSERSILQVSPIVEMEIQFLCEIGRLKFPGKVVVTELMERLGLKISASSFHQVIRQSHFETWTRDPFDRIIVANAKTDGARLLTKDENILANFPQAFIELC
ncbi:PIN domain-containing protein [bacterium]|nr:PIN domain-containing protein [bacterium]